MSKHKRPLKIPFFSSFLPPFLSFALLSFPSLSRLPSPWFSLFLSFFLICDWYVHSYGGMDLETGDEWRGQVFISYRVTMYFLSFQIFLKHHIFHDFFRDLCFDIPESFVLDPEVAKANTLGFLGCLSSVLYNHIAPLKAALRHSTTAPVTIQGTLAEASCGSSLEFDVNAMITEHSLSGTFQRMPQGNPLWTLSVRCL